MTRYSQLKSALIIAVITILLCVVAITGSSLALLTSGEDGKIGINATSGQLEVDIVDTSANPQTLVGEVLDFITTSENPTILFEPGASHRTEGFRVKNCGNIPLNYILYISEDREVRPDFFRLFDVYIVTDADGGEIKTDMENFEGRLEPYQSSDIYYLVFHMKESVDNEFQGRPFTGVGVTVCAVQGNVELK